MKRLPALAAVLLAAAIVAADVVWPAGAPHRSPMSARREGGVVSCPVARENAGDGLVHVAAERAADVQIVFAPVEGEVVTRQLRMGARTVRTVRVPKAVRGRTAAIVRYTGGPVAASHTVVVRARRNVAAGVAASVCRPVGDRVIAVAHLRTLRAESVLSVFNPGSGPATVTIRLLADGEVIERERLERQAVRPRTRRDFRLGDFAFDTRDLTAVIDIEEGRVVAEALVRSADGAALVTAVPASESLVASVARSGPGATLGVALVGEDDAGLSGRLISTTEQGRAATVPESVAPGGGARVAVPARNARGPVALAVDVTVGSPVVAAASWQRGRARALDAALLEATGATRRWFAVAGGPGASVQLFITNAGPRAVTANVARFGSSVAELRIEAGRVAVVRMPRAPSAVGAIVDATGPVAVALEASGRLAGRRWVTGLAGAPDEPDVPVGVRIDPHTGIPAVGPTTAQ